MKPGDRVELKSGQTGCLIKVVKSHLSPRYDRVVIRLDDPDGEHLPIVPVVRFVEEVRVITPPSRLRGL